jgi:hypothetical protein
MQCASEDVDYPRVSGMSALMSSASARSISVRLPKREMPIQRTAENPRGRCIAVAGPGREDDSGQAVALLQPAPAGGPAGSTRREATHVLPHCPPAVRVQAR